MAVLRRLFAIRHRPVSGSDRARLGELGFALALLAGGVRRRSSSASASPRRARSRRRSASLQPLRGADSSERSARRTACLRRACARPRSGPCARAASPAPRLGLGLCASPRSACGSACGSARRPRRRRRSRPPRGHAPGVPAASSAAQLVVAGGRAQGLAGAVDRRRPAGAVELPRRPSPSAPPPPRSARRSPRAGSPASPPASASLCAASSRSPAAIRPSAADSSARTARLIAAAGTLGLRSALIRFAASRSPSLAGSLGGGVALGDELVQPQRVEAPDLVRVARAHASEVTRPAARSPARTRRPSPTPRRSSRR